MVKLIILISFCLFSSFFVYMMLFFVPKASTMPVDTSLVHWADLDDIDSRRRSGEEQYHLRCKKCHGFEGRASRKPLTLNDTLWFNGDGSLSMIYSVISEGLPSKNMFGWKKKLRRDDLINLSLYVKHLSGESEYVRE
ncbi:MAG: hypothetical protein VW378_01170 [bacterium]